MSWRKTLQKKTWENAGDPHARVGMGNNLEVIIQAPGDPSVGIPSATWKFTGGIYIDDTEERESIRASLKEAFDQISGETVFVVFSDEER
jgi:hypothetical protein